jgi:uncharacterized membrane protein (DUF106 family)
MVFAAKVINAIVNTLFSPLGKLSFGLGIIASSAITGIVMLLIFLYTSNQEKIKRVKDIIKGYILEIRLYKDSPGVIMRAFVTILKKNMTYLRYAFVPLLFVILPVILILVNLNFRYNYRGFQPGEKVVVKAQLVRDADIRAVRLSVPDGLILETPGVHLQDSHEIDWRLRIDRQGDYDLNFEYDGERISKRIVAKSDLELLSPVRVDSRFVPVLLNPAESPLPGSSKFTRIEVSYPARVNAVLGMTVHWLVAFFVVSLVFAFALKGPFRVEI